MGKRQKSSLWLYFTGIVFATILAVFILMTVLWYLLYKNGLVSISPYSRHVPLLMFLVGSLLIGGIVAIYVGRKIIRPIQNISNAFETLSTGDFSVKVPEDTGLLEIQEMARRFNAMTYDLSHVETLRSDFVVGVSHEFKTPIAAIEGYATLLQDPRLTPEKHNHYIEVILENSRRLSNLSSGILTLSKLENQELVPNQRTYRLDEQLRKCILMLESKWSVKKIEFDMDLPRLSIYSSEQLLEQVWSNILDNAIKFSPEGSEITVTLQQTQDHISVTITDKGDGMTEEVQKHIFDKFYQGDPSRKSEGNGIGLALVKRIVELCHGSVTVTSAPGKGASFTVTLPNI